MISKINAQSGFSIITTMIAIVMVALLVLGTIAAMSQFSVLTANAERRQDITGVITAIERTLNAPTLCDQALQAPISGGPASISFASTSTISVDVHLHNSTSGTDSLFFTTDTTNPTYNYVGPNLTIASMTLSEQSPGVPHNTISTQYAPYAVGAPVASAKTYTVYVLYLTVTFNNGTDTLVGTSGEQIPIVLAVNTLNPADYRCFMNVSDQQACEANGGYIDQYDRCKNTMFDQITNYGQKNYNCSDCGGATPPTHCGACPANPCGATNIGYTQWTMSGFATDGLPNCVCQYFCHP